LQSILFETTIGRRQGKKKNKLLCVYYLTLNIACFTTSLTIRYLHLALQMNLQTCYKCHFHRQTLKCHWSIHFVFIRYEIHFSISLLIITTREILDQICGVYLMPNSMHHNFCSHLSHKSNLKENFQFIWVSKNDFNAHF
jgi:hypothetical protein